MESLQALYTERTGDVFWRHLFVRVVYLQDERQLARVSPEEFGIVRPEQRLSPCKLATRANKRRQEMSYIFDASDYTVVTLDYGKPWLISVKRELPNLKNVALFTSVFHLRSIEAECGGWKPQQRKLIHCNFLRKHFQPFGLNLVLPSVVKPSGEIAERGKRHPT